MKKQISGIYTIIDPQEINDIVNLCSRIGMNLLVKIIDFNFKSVNDFYDSTYRYHWNTFIDPKVTFSIDSIVIKNFN